MSVYTESWFPICEDCPEDASALVLAGSVWVFHCDVHRGWADTPLRRVWEGWRPVEQGSAWRAALTACMGVSQPVWLAEVGPDVFDEVTGEGVWSIREDHGQVYACRA